MRREVAADLFEPLEGPDLVEALTDLPGGELAPLEQGSIERRQVGGRPVRHPVERPPGENAEAVVQMPHAGGPAGLVVREETSLGELDVALIPPVLVPEDRHERGLPAPVEFPLHGPVVARQVGVPDRKSTRLNSSHGYIPYDV